GGPCLVARRHAGAVSGREGIMQFMAQAAAVSAFGSVRDAPPDTDSIRPREMRACARAQAGSDATSENVVELKPVTDDAGGPDGGPAEESFPTLEGSVRAAMIAAATAVIEPWLSANFGQAVERYLGGRVREIANEMVSARLMEEIPAL